MAIRTVHWKIRGKKGSFLTELFISAAENACAMEKRYCTVGQDIVNN